MLLELQDGIIYGPVQSRRYGRSLGINLMPSRYKLCSFNCVYCHYGWTHKCTLEIEKSRPDLPAMNDVVAALRRALRISGRLDLITFSGNGEPSLHPDFPAIVETTLRLRDEFKPTTRVALLSNSTGLLWPEVRAAIERIDLPIMKLDAGTETTFTAMNRPAAGIRFEDIVARLVAQKDIYIQTVLVGGHPANSGEEELAAYFDLLARIRPLEVHLHSIDRPVPDAGIALIPPERLEAIAAEGTCRTGVPIRAFYVGQRS